MSRAEYVVWERRRKLRDRANSAIEEMKKHAEFARFHVQALEQIDDTESSLRSHPPRSSERFQVVAARLDARAAAYIELVNDLRSQANFAALLAEYRMMGMEEFTGLSGYAVQFRGDTQPEQLLKGRVKHWIKASFRRLIPVEKAGEVDDPPEDDRVDNDPEGDKGDEESRREALLAEYKAATGNPSSRSIYTASNSKIHKPQFYEWLNGTLSAESETAINFEAFLKRKKPPIPRTPRD